MNIEKDFFILCENILLDNNKISLINIYENILAQKLPAYHGKLSFASRLIIKNPSKEEKKIKISLSIKSPSGANMLVTPLIQERDVNTAFKKQTIGLAFYVEGVVFNEFGEYNVDLLINDNISISLQFQVILITNKRNGKSN